MIFSLEKSVLKANLFAWKNVATLNYSLEKMGLYAKKCKTHKFLPVYQYKCKYMKSEKSAIIPTKNEASNSIYFLSNKILGLIECAENPAMVLA